MTNRTVLVADDDRSTRELVGACLEEWGYAVVPADDGERAWEILRQPEAPRLAVIDWMMPGLSGIDVCRRLRERDELPYTYAILLTARGEREDESEGFAAGADDFLVKPVDAVALRQRLTVGARVVTAEAELRRSRRDLARYAAEMEDLADARARQLVHADRMATLGMLSAGVAHEINNPATFIGGNVQVLRECWPDARDALAALPSPPPRVAFFLEETPKIIEAISKGVGRIARIVSGLKTYVRQDRGERAPLDLNETARQALELCINALKRHVETRLEIDETLPPVVADAQQIEQVFVNLFVNAADAMERRGRGTLWVRTRREEETVVAEVEDDGPGLPANIIDKIWDPFFTTKEPGKGTGLGLSIIQGIIASHGGSIEATNRPEGGARFVVRLPPTARPSEGNAMTGAPSYEGIQKEVASHERAFADR